MKKDLIFDSEALVDESGNHLGDGSVEASKVEGFGVCGIGSFEFLRAACAHHPPGLRAHLRAVPVN